MEVNKLLSQIASDLDMLYLRATDPDANVRMEQIDLKSLPIMLYNNLLEVEYTLGASTVALYPLEIRILKLGYFDNNTEDADYIINRCRELAEQVAKRLLVSPIIIPDDFTVDALDTYEIYDEIMTGVTLRIDVAFTLSC